MFCVNIDNHEYNVIARRFSTIPEWKLHRRNIRYAINTYTVNMRLLKKKIKT